MIAALYVIEQGVYYNIRNVDPWPLNRDAREYLGPYPVVAHPPCARWGRYWSGGPSAKVRRNLGDDNGCFAAALACAKQYGGVIEHPEGSHAWRLFRIPRPPKGGGWIKCIDGAWTCCVEQGHYGHRARKATWLIAYKIDTPPSLIWGRSENKIQLDDGFHSAEERRRTVRTGICQRLSKKQRLETPLAFRDLLISIAEMVSNKPI